MIRALRFVAAEPFVQIAFGLALMSNGGSVNIMIDLARPFAWAAFKIRPDRCGYKTFDLFK